MKEKKYEIDSDILLFSILGILIISVWLRYTIFLTDFITNINETIKLIVNI